MSNFAERGLFRGLYADFETPIAPKSHWTNSEAIRGGDYPSRSYNLSELPQVEGRRVNLDLISLPTPDDYLSLDAYWGSFLDLTQSERQAVFPDSSFFYEQDEDESKFIKGGEIDVPVINNAQMPATVTFEQVFESFADPDLNATNDPSLARFELAHHFLLNLDAEGLEVQSVDLISWIAESESGDFYLVDHQQMHITDPIPCDLKVQNRLSQDVNDTTKTRKVIGSLELIRPDSTSVTSSITSRVDEKINLIHFENNSNFKKIF